MAPLDDLIHLLLITFKDGLHTAIPSVFNPTFYSESESHLLGVMAEKDPLDSPLNDYMGPNLIHILNRSSENHGRIKNYHRVIFFSINKFKLEKRDLNRLKFFYYFSDEVNWKKG
jgi:hypothetical protein